jgi:hypothetical protein
MVESDLAKVSVDASLIEDLAALITENDIEDIIKQGFMSRIKSKYVDAGKIVDDEQLELLSNAYIKMLNRLKTLNKARSEYNQMAGRVKLVEQAAIRSIDVSKEQIGLVEMLEQAADETVPASSRTIQEELLDTILDLIPGMREVEPTVSPVETRYTRIGDMFRRLMGNPDSQLGAMFSANKGKIAIGSAVAAAAGLAVFALKSKKDTTAEELSGPPLLPGGNPYERLPQAPNQPSQSPVVPGGSGTSYNVSINASQDEIDEFMTRAGYLSNGQIQGTMHDSLPDLGRNPYDHVAGSF